VSEYLRLAAATAVVLAPGWVLARALGQRGASAALAFALAAIFAAWAVVFTVHGSIWLAFGLLAAIGGAAILGLLLRRPRPLPTPVRGRWIVFAGGTVLGVLLWHVAGIVSGDGLFHEGRVRKLVELGNLHLRTVDEFKDGGLHPGYAFPLWHGFLALVSKLSGLDPAVVVNHEGSILAPLACLVVWEAGVVMFESGSAGIAVLAATVALYCFAPGHGGSWTSLALPATAARQLLVPAGIALFFAYVKRPGWEAWAALAALFGALALVHPTYALFALLPLAGYALLRPAEWRASLLALAACCIPAGLAFLWLRPIVDETISHDPGPVELARALHHYAGELQVWSLHRYRLAPEVLGRTGAVAVAALVLIPLAGFLARRSRAGAYVLGGSLIVLALMLIPTLFVHFSDAVSISQSRRAAGFLPFAFAFAAGFALLARTWLVLPVALGAGIVLQRKWPGDFAYGLRHGGPAIATWIAFVGGAVALCLLLRRWDPKIDYRLGALAALLFVAPVVVHGLAHWSPRVTRDPQALSPALVHELRSVPPRSVIIAPLETSYRLVAAAPVYVVAAPVAHVADTKANRPLVRAAAVAHWLKTGDPAVPREYGATWEVVGGHLRRLTLGGR
jgi:hypothetical protein